jgi:hypothetical protein
MKRKSKTRAVLFASIGLIVLAAAVAAQPRRGAPKAPVAALAPPPAPVAAAPAPAPPPVAPAPGPVQGPPAPPPRVEVVFVLDTTGSMSGLIRGAKEKIWSIANHIAGAQPTPEVSIGLVGYRDRGDTYVTKVHALNPDLDAVFEKLMAFKADGGGDTPEHVAKAMHDAVNRMQWSDGAMKMIFLVGDAPPQDYGDYDLKSILKQARKKEIAVYTIRAGSDATTAQAWKQIASLGGGTYASIKQSGGVARVATPFDRDLARLSGELAGTTVVVGDAEAHRRVARKAAAAADAPAESSASRGSYYAKTKKRMDDADLLEELAEGDKDVAAIDEAELPSDMRGRSADEKRKIVVVKKERREAIMKEMGELTKKRDAYLREESKKAKAAPGREAGFDGVVTESIEKQAADYGMAF